MALATPMASVVAIEEVALAWVQVVWEDPPSVEKEALAVPSEVKAALAPL